MGIGNFVLHRRCQVCKDLSFSLPLMGIGNSSASRPRGDLGHLVFSLPLMGIGNWAPVADLTDDGITVELITPHGDR